ncbi:MAG: type II secretion system protein [Kiritimatiellae bacterium]|nr:type II secretion system protein [Kiritimatiellia bacterium]
MKQRSTGFSLLELVMVVAVLGIVAVFAVNRVSRVVDQARITAAEHDLALIRDAFVSPESGYLRDMRGIPGFSLGYLRIANLLMSTNLYGEVRDGTDRQRGFRVDGESRPAVAGCAASGAFTGWDAEAGRGWRGPYVKMLRIGTFPRLAVGRGFTPSVAGLRLPADIEGGIDGCSVYGFPGEPALLDPWGNPYVLQIPPAQAFSSSTATNVPDEVRFRYARVVSAGPDGRLSSPCFDSNGTNDWRSVGGNWLDRHTRLLSRQAGLFDGEDRSMRGDDLVLFLNRNDTDEGEENAF